MELVKKIDENGPTMTCYHGEWMGKTIKKSKVGQKMLWEHGEYKTKNNLERFNLHNRLVSKTEKLIGIDD